MAAAGLVLVGFGVLTWWLLSKAPTAVSNNETWTRDTYLYNAVQAIVVGAAGVLFGASSSARRATRAEAQADSHMNAAVNGRALAAALKAGRADTQRMTANLTQNAVDDARLRGAADKATANLADQLFPDLTAGP